MAIRNRLTAWLLDRFVPHYNRMAGEVKSRLLAGVEGEVLEIGAGTGANFAYLAQGVRWTGCDPNPGGRRYCERAAAAAGIKADWRTAGAEQLPFDAGRFDAVVSTLTLCSVRSPEAALREVLRVLKPGGTFVFLEHVAADPDSSLHHRQRRWAPVFGALAGCRPHQDTARLIESAGFSSVDVERLALPLPVVSPHAAGRALK